MLGLNSNDSKESRKSSSEAKAHCVFHVEVCKGQRDLVRVAEMWGLKAVEVEKPTSSHPLGAIQRFAIEAREASSKVLNYRDVVVILDPRESEDKVFHDLMSVAHKCQAGVWKFGKWKGGRPTGITVECSRKKIYPGDSAECRFLVEPKLETHRMRFEDRKKTPPQKPGEPFRPVGLKKRYPLSYAAVGNDNAYWHGIKDFFIAHSLDSYPRLGKDGVHCMLSMFDLRVKNDAGFCLFVPHIIVPEKPKRVFVTGDGEIVEIPAEPGLDLV
jgi:hypothetical protein